MKHFAKTRTLKTLLALIALLLAMALLPNLAAAEIQKEHIVLSEKSMSNKQAAKGFISRTMKGVSAQSRAASNTGRAGLNGLEQKLYDAVRPLILKVADGERESTEFSFNISDVFDKTTYTLDELGITGSEGTLIDYRKLVNALLADCPYDLYWFDKTAGFLYYPVQTTLDTSLGTVTINSSMWAISFTVSQNYKAENAANDFQCDTKWGQSAKAAAAKAKEIINTNASKGDVAKLTAYKEAICGLVDYNDAAAAGGVAYGNPWQMVWVFDGDDSTMVVCEGYSKAYQFLCDESDFVSQKVKAISVTGTMMVGESGGPHMWNVVTLSNGKRYLADITNSDKGSIGENGGLFLTGYSQVSEEHWYGYTTETSTVWYYLDDNTINLFGTAEPVTGNENYSDSDEPEVYTITWKNYNGDVLAETKVVAGEKPEYTGEAPTRAATAQYTYTFSGWTPEIVAATADAEYTAQYTETVREYTITWQNDDGSVIDTTTVAYGSVPTHADPTKEATAQYTYTFAGWDPKVVEVTGDATYKATYTANLRSYTITWQNDDGSLIDTTTVAYGTYPEHAAPSKAATSEYTYTFEKWEPDIVVVTGEATYKAKFKATPVPQDSPVQPENPTQPEVPILVGPATTETYSGGLFALDNDNHTATYVGPEDASASEVVIPATIPVEGSDRQYKVTKIVDGAFRNNKNLTKVTIGKNVAVIGKNTFSGCSALQTVSGGANVVTIEAGAFQKCTVLTGITIGKKVTTIAKNAFSGCKKLKNITVKSKKLKTVGKKAFKGIAADAVFKCPKVKLADYETLIRKAGAPKTAKFTK